MDTRASDRIAEEQAALRRVATLVAGGAPPEEVFAAVTEEAGRLLGADITGMSRYDADGMATEIGVWTRMDTPMAIAVGDRLGLGGRNVTTLVYQTGRPARIDDYGESSGVFADAARGSGARSSAGVPIIVGGRLWGVVTVGSARTASVPADTEARLAGFTELVGTAIANAQARVELRAYAEEQAALRRVATLVAAGAPPEEMFAAVAGEIGRVVATEFTSVTRYSADDTATIVGVWTRTGTIEPPAVGDRLSLGGQNIATLVHQTGQSARMDDYSEASGVFADIARGWGARSGVGVPIRVGGRLWGVVNVWSARKGALPADTGARLAGFTELVGTAIANAEARVELRGYAEEQAALRRVAVLVACGAPPEEVFAAVAEEVGRVLGADFTSMSRYDADGMATEIGVWTRTGTPLAIAVGDRLGLGGRNVVTLVYQTGRPARIDDYGESSGVFADAARGSGVRSAAGVPIIVGGRLWGVVTVGSARTASVPADTEARLAGFTELVGTGIANAEAQAALAASRARIVAAGDEARRRVERDLHDGAQQHLVALALQLRGAQATAPPGAGELVKRLDGVAAGLETALEELREIARGIHPAVLAEGGLRPALRALARRSAVPVRLDVQVANRLPDPVEIAAYYVVSEALTNTAKHARATAAEVEVAAGEGVLRVRIRDDGRGGADFGHGSGQVGLKDRVEALGGRITLHSPPGTGTTLEVHIPLGNCG